MSRTNRMAAAARRRLGSADIRSLERENKAGFYLTLCVTLSRDFPDFPRDGSRDSPDFKSGLSILNPDFVSREYPDFLGPQSLHR